ncbi:MAG: glycine cleavage system protein GcvH [Dichotomicrobium sp.]
MSDTRYTKDHEYIRVEGETGVIGISNHAQEQLGEVVFVELPEVGKEVTQGDELAVVESVKAASEVYAPVSGEVTEINDGLTTTPEKVNADAEGEAWFVKLKIADKGELDKLMSAADYKSYLESLD